MDRSNWNTAEGTGNGIDSTEVIKVDPSMTKDTQIGVEDLNQEVSVANEMDLVGPQDSKLQQPDLMISSCDAFVCVGQPQSLVRESYETGSHFMFYFDNFVGQ